MFKGLLLKNISLKDVKEKNAFLNEHILQNKNKIVLNLVGGFASDIKLMY